MIIYSTIPPEQKNHLVQEFVETTIDLPNPDNYPKTVQTMFRVFLYCKGIEV